MGDFWVKNTLFYYIINLFNKKVDKIRKPCYDSPIKYERGNFMNIQFRPLKAEEIEVRYGSISEYGAVVLLYKDARADMNILDETVGALNWKREHIRDNKNCIVSIWDSEKGQWISKEDTGTESYSEREKGLASDSFKRACVNWGIGRELYSAPKIFLPAAQLKTLQRGANGRYRCYDEWKVTEVVYGDDRTILRLVLHNLKSNAFISFGQGKKISEKIVQKLISACRRDGVDIGRLCHYMKAGDISLLTEKQCAYIHSNWRKIVSACQDASIFPAERENAYGR